MPRPARRRLVLTTALLLPVLLVAAWVAAQAFYRPLEQGSGQFGFGVVQDGELSPQPQQELTNAFGTEFRVVAPALGSEVSLVLGLSNGGPFAVEVLDVGSPWPFRHLPAVRAFASDAPGGSGLPLTPMAPFRLAAGGNRDVGVVVRIAGCPGGPSERNAGAVVAGDVPVTWRWLGRTHVTRVPLDFRASLEREPACGAS